ncbi:MAG: aminoacyl-tRNA hydrolase [Verrucomicrobia bacterium]|nr:MAG: aminoacyl-tRNA hydrolase [Verrucomicrobiota bacterium]
MEGAFLRLIVGLGNPGNVYKRTRHNIGFMVLDQLAKKRNCLFKREGKIDITRDPLGRFLMKPMNYMNLSGQPVGEFTRYYKISPEEVLIVLDDSALPTGALRIRKKGSAGGHNGLASILHHLSTEAVPRLRIGIGAANHNMTDHVLSEFSREETLIMEQATSRACEAIEIISSCGMDLAMNQFN